MLIYSCVIYAFVLLVAVASSLCNVHACDLLRAVDHPYV